MNENILEQNRKSPSSPDSHDSFFDDVILTFPNPRVISYARFTPEQAPSSTQDSFDEPIRTWKSVCSSRLPNETSTPIQNIQYISSTTLQKQPQSQLNKIIRQSSNSQDSFDEPIRTWQSASNSRVENESSTSIQNVQEPSGTTLPKEPQSQLNKIIRQTSQDSFDEPIRTWTSAAERRLQNPNIPEPSSDSVVRETLNSSNQSIEQETVPCSLEVQGDTVNTLGSQDSSSNLTQPPPPGKRLKEEQSTHASLDVMGDTINQLGSQDSDITLPPPSKRPRHENPSHDKITSVKIEVDTPELNQRLLELNEAGSQCSVHLRYDRLMNRYYPGVDCGCHAASMDVNVGSPAQSINTTQSEARNQLPVEKENQSSPGGTEFLTICSFSGVTIAVKSPELRSTVIQGLTSVTNPPLKKQIKQELPSQIQANRRLKMEVPEVPQAEIPEALADPIRVKTEDQDEINSVSSLEALCGSQQTQVSEQAVPPPGSQKPRSRKASLEVHLDEQSQRECCCGAVCLCLLATET